MSNQPTTKENDIVKQILKKMYFQVLLLNNGDISLEDFENEIQKIEKKYSKHLMSFDYKKELI
jgi:hypothetical protein